ncbi:carbamoyl-phosphate synthase domain-containing protein [Candidatus Carsonella ruddii]|uniref:Truncated carbamoylphosphate synthase small subunit n=1 Tax=Candidatus Carsonella ruddii HC isolate Thao2000 TaxID=1202538 RepID=J3VPU7_CARRU|nr:carbamoyl-phosphate synthase domain-containing protein [Candidatus Carsonella ruddii]AFP83931.1 truncated carbamoylphosphate synthase small subunit [Candidatus Carsonella ruddii HC isolate Thao2000]
MLIIESGIIFYCKILNKKNTFGELVFNTSIYGYNEIFSDPSYKSQFLIFSNPHLGNIGVIKQDLQFFKIKLNSIIIRNYSISSNFRKNIFLKSFFKKKNTPIIFNIDTRFLISIIKIIGNQNAFLNINFKNNKKIIKYLRFLNYQKIIYD